MAAAAYSPAIDLDPQSVWSPSLVVTTDDKPDIRLFVIFLTGFCEMVRKTGSADSYKNVVTWCLFFLRTLPRSVFYDVAGMLYSKIGSGKARVPNWKPLTEEGEKTKKENLHKFCIALIGVSSDVNINMGTAFFMILTIKNAAKNGLETACIIYSYIKELLFSVVGFNLEFIDAMDHINVGSISAMESNIPFIVDLMSNKFAVPLIAIKKTASAATKRMMLKILLEKKNKSSLARPVHVKAVFSEEKFKGDFIPVINAEIETMKKIYTDKTEFLFMVYAYACTLGIYTVPHLLEHIADKIEEIYTDIGRPPFSRLSRQGFLAAIRMPSPFYFRHALGLPIPVKSMITSAYIDEAAYCAMAVELSKIIDRMAFKPLVTATTQYPDTERATWIAHIIQSIDSFLGIFPMLTFPNLVTDSRISKTFITTLFTRFTDTTSSVEEKRAVGKSLDMLVSHMRLAKLNIYSTFNKKPDIDHGSLGEWAVELGIPFELYGTFYVSMSKVLLDNGTREQVFEWYALLRERHGDEPQIPAKIASMLEKGITVGTDAVQIAHREVPVDAPCMCFFFYLAELLQKKPSANIDNFKVLSHIIKATNSTSENPDDLCGNAFFDAMRLEIEGIHTRCPCFFFYLEHNLSYNCEAIIKIHSTVCTKDNGTTYLDAFTKVFSANPESVDRDAASVASAVATLAYWDVNADIAEKMMKIAEEAPGWAKMSSIYCRMAAANILGVYEVSDWEYTMFPTDLWALDPK